MIERVPIAERAKGKWPSILPALGVAKEHLTGRHGPCPMCAGNDRWRFDNKAGRGTWFCNSCGSGDGIELVKRVNGWDFKAAAREIEKHVGGAPVTEVRNGPRPEDVRRDMNDIWRGAKALALNSVTNSWWMRRLGSVPDCRDLRAVVSLTCPGQGVHPGMVALVRDAEGKPVNMHRTFLAPGGQKANVAEPRRVMPMPMPKGCAVRLAPLASELAIAEGIETAAAVTALFGAPCWAALNAQNMQDWFPPDGVERVIVFGDHDANFRGQAAAYTLANRLTGKKIGADVRIPPAMGSDWNDVWMAKLQSESAA